MRRKNEIKNAVARVLLEEKLARTDDCYLILEVVKHLEPELAGETFAKVMTQAKYKGISFESITRARRSFMNKHPELKDLEIEQARRKEEENYILEYGGIKKWMF